MGSVVRAVGAQCQVARIRVARVTTNMTSTGVHVGAEVHIHRQGVETTAMRSEHPAMLANAWVACYELLALVIMSSSVVIIGF